MRTAFPNYDWDPLHAQAALAFLLIKNRVSVTVTLGNSFDLVLEDGASLGGGGLPEGSMANPPIGFDFSHQAHRSTRAFMWSRIYEIAGGLMTLLQGEEWRDGQSLWDRTMIYVATDFGRSKTRPSNAGDWGSGHDLNNGLVLLSPMVNGNTVLGGVDSWWGLLALPVTSLAALAVAAPSAAHGARAEMDHSFDPIMRIVVTPMVLFSGTFFPVEQLPVVLEVTVKILPLWHGVELARDATSGTVEAGSALGHTAVMVAYLVVGWTWARREFTRRLAS